MENNKNAFLDLQHSESMVAQMSAIVFAALIQKQELTSTNEDDLVAKSVAIAIKLASQTEKVVKSDEEWKTNNTGSAYLGG